MDRQGRIAIPPAFRRKIEDDPKAPKYIKTVWGGGYSFAIEVRKL